MADNQFKAFFEQLSKIEDDLEKVVPELGKQAADDIRRRTRAGYGTDTNGGNKSRLAALTDEYKKARRRMPLSTETSPNKSNLTQTGSMLDSLEFVRVGKFEGIVVPTGSDEKGVSNADKALYVTDQGRPFMFLSKAETKRLEDTLRKRLNDIIKKIF